MWGVKIENKRINAKIKQKDARGFLSPWIFDPSHRRRLGQKTTIISGVPELAKNRKGIERIVRMLARSATLLLNQRFKSKTSKKPRAVAIRMLGSLMANVVKPKIRIESF